MTPNKKNGLLLFILVAAVLVYSFSGNSIGIALDFGDTALTVSAASRDWTLDYDQIASIALSDLPDVGTPADGTDQRKLQCGVWENETWGTYTLCVSPKISRCIVLTMHNGDIFVLNYESADSTASLYEMFAGLLQSKGYTS